MKDDPRETIDRWSIRGGDGNAIRDEAGGWVRLDVVASLVAERDMVRQQCDYIIGKHQVILHALKDLITELTTGEEMKSTGETIHDARFAERLTALLQESLPHE